MKIFALLPSLAIAGASFFAAYVQAFRKQGSRWLHFLGAALLIVLGLALALLVLPTCASTSMPGTAVTRSPCG